MSKSCEERALNAARRIAKIVSGDLDVDDAMLDHFVNIIADEFAELEKRARRQDLRLIQVSELAKRNVDSVTPLAAHRLANEMLAIVEETL